MTVSADWKSRELEILQLMSHGLTNSEIAARLHLSDETVRWYNKHIFRKLNVTNRFQAVHVAAEQGLLTNEEIVEKVEALSTPHRSPVQYIANGDVHIAYQVIGNGPVDLLFIHGFLSHLEQAWENEEFTRFFSVLGQNMRVILFDKRGVGLSDRIQGAPTLETTITDALTVLDAVGSKHAFIMGTSEGGAAAVLLASTYPDRVRGLILYAALPTIVRTDNEPEWATPIEEFEQMLDRMQSLWGGPWAIENFAPSRAHDEKFRAWWSMILRSASSPSSVRAVLNIQREVDIRPLLPQIPIKTLVLHKKDDRIANVEAGRYFATHMPNARWVELPGKDHIYFVDSDALLSHILQFSQETQMPDVIDTSIAIILYVIVNDNGQSIKALRDGINQFHPKHMGNEAQAIFALFDSPSRAITCAKYLRNDNKFSMVKISLNVGACYILNGKPLDHVLETSMLVANLASPGEIVITSTLHDILAGSDFIFNERNVFPSQLAQKQLMLWTL